MIQQVVDLIATSVGAASDLFLLILDRTDSFDLVLSALIALIIGRVLLSVFTGFTSSPMSDFGLNVSSASDRATRQYESAKRSSDLAKARQAFYAKRQAYWAKRSSRSKGGSD